MAVMTMEKLIALGAKNLVVFGWCGSLDPSLKIGDVLLPTWAVSEEGTSNHYPINKQPASSPGLRAQLSSHLLQHGIPPTQGPVWTTDAPYRETREKVTEYSGRGILGVDMEFSAMSTLAAFRRVEMGAVFIVSDELWQKEWNPGYRNKNFRKKCRSVLEILIEFCGSCADG